MCIKEKLISILKDKLNCFSSIDASDRREHTKSEMILYVWQIGVTVKFESGTW